METTKKHLIINIGASYSNTLPVKHSNGSLVNTSGYSANSKFTREYGYGNSIPFICSIANSYVTIELTANTTSNLVSGRYVYDIKITDANGIVTRLYEGFISANPSVT